MKIQEVFGSEGFNIQFTHQELVAFRDHLSDDMDLILHDFNEDDFSVKYHFSLFISSTPKWIKGIKSRNLVPFDLVISGTLGGPSLNLNDLFDGDDVLPSTHDGKWNKRIQQIRNAAKALIKSWEKYGLKYVSPNDSDEKIIPDKFNSDAHINYIEDHEDYANIDVDLTLWFEWPLVQGVYESVKSENLLVEEIKAAVKMIFPVEDSFVEAVEEGEHSNLGTGFFYFFDFETNFVGFDLTSLYDGPRNSVRALQSKIASASDPKFDNDKWLAFSHNFERLLIKWKRLGLESITIKSPNQEKSYRSTDLKFQGDFFFYMLMSINHKSKKLELRFTLRFPSQT